LHDRQARFWTESILYCTRLRRFRIIVFLKHGGILYWKS
jgi:hypothetical protein